MGVHDTFLFSLTAVIEKFLEVDTRGSTHLITR